MLEPITFGCLGDHVTPVEVMNIWRKHFQSVACYLGITHNSRTLFAASPITSSLVTSFRCNNTTASSNTLTVRPLQYKHAPPPVPVDEKFAASVSGSGGLKYGLLEKPCPTLATDLPACKLVYFHTF